MNGQRMLTGEHRKPYTWVNHDYEKRRRYEPVKAEKEEKGISKPALAAILCMVVLMFAFAMYKISQYNEAESKVEMQRALNAYVEDENNSLLSSIQDACSQNTISQLASERFGMVYSGDRNVVTVYIPSVDGSVATAYAGGMSK